MNYIIFIMFTYLSHTGQVTIGDFESKETCESFKRFHLESIEPYIKGFYKLPIDIEIEIKSISCEKQTI